MYCDVPIPSSSACTLHRMTPTCGSDGPELVCSCGKVYACPHSPKCPRGTVTRPRHPAAELGGSGSLTARYVGDLLDLVLHASDDSIRAVAASLRDRAAVEPDHLKRLTTYHLARFADDVLERRELRRRLAETHR